MMRSPTDGQYITIGTRVKALQSGRRATVVKLTEAVIGVQYDDRVCSGRGRPPLWICFKTRNVMIACTLKEPSRD